MNLNLDDFKIEFNNISPKIGNVLLAEPFTNSSYFMRSVVLMTEYNKNGSVGFILNKPTKFNINSILKDFPEIDAKIWIGGPVQSNVVYYLHTLGEQIPDSVKIKDNLFLGGDFNYLKLLIEVGAVSKNQIRFFLGYSGWTSMQLDNELKKHFWVVSDINEKDVINIEEYKNLWKNLVNELGGKYKLWKNFRTNPNLN